MTSVVYMGRGSFRMEAVALAPEPELESDRGIVQHMSGVVTAPLHAPDGRDAQDDDSSHRSPDLRALFGSQDGVPMLAAPTGSVSLRAAPAVTLSRATLGALGGLVLLCGIVVGTAARHLLAAPAPLATVAAPEVPTPAPVKFEPTIVLAATPAPTAPPPVAAPVATTPVPTPLPRAPLPPPLTTTPVAPSPARATVPKHASTAAKREPVAAAPPAAKPAQKPWVDPWAN